jgi:flagella basal body P-ring formation protein FlgA
MMIGLWFRSGSMRLAAAILVCLAGATTAGAGAGSVQLPVPRVTIYPGQVIDDGMLADQAFRQSIAINESLALSRTALVGKVARQTLLPGRPVTINAIREPFAVTQGQAALFVFRSGSLTISGNGLALQSGGIGDVVSVRNIDSGRIVQGTIGADGSVHVGDR